MIFAGPSVAEERARALRALVPSIGEKLPPDPWKHYKPLLAVVFFGLTILAMNAFSLLLHLLSIPKGLVTLVAAIALAEWLIRRGRYFGTGIEAALWIGGLFTFIFDLPSSGRPEAMLVFFAAAALAGYRVKSALFGVLAAVCVVVYFAWKFDDNVYAAMLCAIAICVAAAVALTREWQRPSTERLFSGLVTAMPIVGWAAGRIVELERFGAIEVVFLFAFLGAVLMGAGLGLRHRALLAGGAVSWIAAGIEGQNLLPWSAEARLIGAGFALVATAFLASRLLRGRTRGLVIAKERERYELLQMAGAMAAAHPAHPETAPQRQSGGGEFGGAGATGEF